ncbi:putative holliday junction resolvase [Apostasia shenzhenica]|uniref:Putative holliday junction resolvase n=1 Tax=Apostasia shenzhenica TaxID=1088818 RepID=A0A2H9ZT54_9ASPA|nr:putative holliday junction resolvase [Apostasia shenzhenica]
MLPAKPPTTAVTFEALCSFGFPLKQSLGPYRKFILRTSGFCCSPKATIDSEGEIKPNALRRRSSACWGGGGFSLGVDLGDSHTGVALGKGFSPRPLTVLEMRGQKLERRLLQIAELEEVDEFIIGLPKSHGGKETPQSNKVRSIAGRFAVRAAERGLKRSARHKKIDAYSAMEIGNRLLLRIVVGLEGGGKEMDGCKCFCWKRGRVYDFVSREPESFSLPSAMPEWPVGKGFAKGSIYLGEIEVVKITKFESIWSCYLQKNKRKGATFYRPSDIPDGFFCLGHYGQVNDHPFRGFLLAARAVSSSEKIVLPALRKPIDYELIWSSSNWQDDDCDESGCFWLPCPPQGYRAVGYVVTKDCSKPSLDEVRCVRADLTDTCERYEPILTIDSSGVEIPITVWKTRPSCRGIWCKGVSVGTFCCSMNVIFDGEMDISCLKNLDPYLPSMPNLDQINALIKHYGPTVFFHPKETYLPSSVSWFFRNGAMLYKRDEEDGEAIDALGLILPDGGDNDGEYWIDLPDDDRSNLIKHGNIESAKLYVHVKPALGGTFTDIAMWVFCPFNGPAILKIGLLTISLKKLGQHVGDWEHFTLRICNFTGELWSIYFSQHSGGEWIDASDLEFIESNRAIVYSSRNGHASFPHPGMYLQGSRKLGIGVRNDAASSKFFIDSSVSYQIIAAEYLGDTVSEPCWLQYMREWGPTVVYNSKTELDKIISHLPINLRFSVESIFDKLPLELYGEEGPTGPKQKDNWIGDERS